MIQCDSPPCPECGEMQIRSADSYKCLFCVGPFSVLLRAVKDYVRADDHMEALWAKASDDKRTPQEYGAEWKRARYALEDAIKLAEEAARPVRRR